MRHTPVQHQCHWNRWWRGRRRIACLSRCKRCQIEAWVDLYKKYWSQNSPSRYGSGWRSPASPYLPLDFVWCCCCCCILLLLTWEAQGLLRNHDPRTSSDEAVSPCASPRFQSLSWHPWFRHHLISWLGIAGSWCVPVCSRLQRGRASPRLLRKLHKLLSSCVSILPPHWHCILFLWARQKPLIEALVCLSLWALSLCARLWTLLPPSDQGTAKAQLRTLPASF